VVRFPSRIQFVRASCASPVMAAYSHGAFTLTASPLEKFPSSFFRYRHF